MIPVNISFLAEIDNERGVALTTANFILDLHLQTARQELEMWSLWITYKPLVVLF